MTCGIVYSCIFCAMGSCPIAVGNTFLTNLLRTLLFLKYFGEAEESVACRGGNVITYMKRPGHGAWPLYQVYSNAIARNYVDN
jgi:hypothetical protein